MKLVILIALLILVARTKANERSSSFMRLVGSFSK